METFYIGQKFKGIYPPEAAFWCNEHHAMIVDICDGSYEIVSIPEPTMDVLLKEYERAIQKHLDSAASYKGYDNTYTCLSYLNSTDSKWKVESNEFNVWRDKVWQTSHQILDSFIAGEIERPSIQEVISMLPKIGWGDY